MSPKLCSCDWVVWAVGTREHGDLPLPTSKIPKCLQLLGNLAPRLAFSALLMFSETRELDVALVVRSLANRERFAQHVERYRNGSKDERSLMQSAILADFEGTIHAIGNNIRNYELAQFVPHHPGENNPVALSPILAILAFMTDPIFVNSMEEINNPFFNRSLAAALSSHCTRESGGFNITTPLSQMVELDLSGSGIVMEYENEYEEKLFILPQRLFRSLTTLNLSQNRILSINFLAELPTLIELDISFPKVTNSYSGDSFGQDLTPLQHCTALKKLNISNNDEITDLIPLQLLTSLVELKMEAVANDTMASIVTLAEHGTLKTLCMGNNFCNILDFDACLPRLTNLSELSITTQNEYVGDNTLGEPLRRRADHCSLVMNLTNLTSLSLISLDLQDISQIVQLTNLRTLCLDGNPLQDVTPLTSLLSHVEMYTGPREQQPLPPPSTTPAFVNGMSEVDFQLIQIFPYIRPRTSNTSSNGTSSTSSSTSSSSTTTTTTTIPAPELSRASSIEDETCTICIEEFIESEAIMALPRCLHKFHPNCLKEHVLTSKCCPNCREPILNGNDGSNESISSGKDETIERTCGQCHETSNIPSSARFCMFCGQSFD